MSNSVGSIALDGSSSDLTRQLYYRAKANDSILVTLNSVPDAVQNRLDKVDLDWNKLPGVAQLALLWDSGFAINSNYDAVQIWTLGHHNMSTLALTLDEYQEAGCVPKNCTEPDNTLIYESYHCNGAQMNNAAKCVVEEFDDPIKSYNAAMWGIGGNSGSPPMIRMAKHAWTDNSTGTSYVVMALHTVTLDNEPGWDACPSTSLNGGYGSLVFPCRTTAKLTAENKQEMKTVTGSEWVNEWLVADYMETAAKDSDGFNMLLLIPIILGALVILALIWLGFYCKKKRQERAGKEFEESTTGESPYLAPSNKSFDQRETARPTVTVSEDMTSTYTGADQTIQFPAYGGEFVSGGSNTTLKVLLTSAYLVGKRIPLENLKFEKAMSKGASGEVWICEYADDKVAAKRLLQSKENKAEDVHEFALEIELNAHLQHPNIGAFIGVAWNSLNNLTMVIEYFPLGDLQRYLKKNGDLLSWARDKIHMAVGVARALVYLHGYSPPIIHRDLKSKNILLTKQLEPKVIDFGVSRGRLDNTMTAGVGTPFWTAPEILEGKRYSEQADIYSFGVVLSELDTCKVPFYDCMGSNGKKAKPFHILQEVMTGMLRPSFSKDCPPRIRRIGVLCCQHDPARRPTAAQLVEMLQGE